MTTNGSKIRVEFDRKTRSGKENALKPHLDLPLTKKSEDHNQVSDSRKLREARVLRKHILNR